MMTVAIAAIVLSLIVFTASIAVLNEMRAIRIRIRADLNRILLAEKRITGDMEGSSPRRLSRQEA